MFATIHFFVGAGGGSKKETPIHDYSNLVSIFIPSIIHMLKTKSRYAHEQGDPVFEIS